MKTGLTLEQLAAEITRQQSAKEDYVVNTGNLRLESYGPDLTLRVLDSDGADRIEPLEIGDIAHRQIGTHLSIPAKYYERMRSEDPGLLAHNVNTWLERTPAQRMIRVLDGKARAYLSNRYLRMDNYSIASAVLPILAEIPDVRIESCQITDSRMYIKAVNPRLVMVVGDQRVHLVIVYTLQSRFIFRSKLLLHITLQFMHTHVSKQLFRRVGIADLAGNKPLYLFRARFVICLEQLTNQM